MTEVVVDPTMVERVAKAIWTENAPAGAPTFDELDFLDQGRVKMIARACILAMKEPTQEMVDAVYATKLLPVINHDLASEDTKAVWETMIDAALKED